MAPAQRGYAQRSSKPKPGRKPRQGKEVANAVSIDNDSNTNEVSHRSPHDDVSDLINMAKNNSEYGDDIDYNTHINDAPEAAISGDVESTATEQSNASKDGPENLPVGNWGSPYHEDLLTPTGSVEDEPKAVVDRGKKASVEDEPEPLFSGSRKKFEVKDTSRLENCIAGSCDLCRATAPHESELPSSQRGQKTTRPGQTKLCVADLMEDVRAGSGSNWDPARRRTIRASSRDQAAFHADLQVAGSKAFQLDSRFRAEFERDCRRASRMHDARVRELGGPSAGDTYEGNFGHHDSGDGVSEVSSAEMQQAERIALERKLMAKEGSFGSVSSIDEDGRDNIRRAQWIKKEQRKARERERKGGSRYRDENYLREKYMNAHNIDSQTRSFYGTDVPTLQAEIERLRRRAKPEYGEFELRDEDTDDTVSEVSSAEIDEAEDKAWREKMLGRYGSPRSMSPFNEGGQANIKRDQKAKKEERRTREKERRKSHGMPSGPTAPSTQVYVQGTNGHFRAVNPDGGLGDHIPYDFIMGRHHVDDNDIHHGIGSQPMSGASHMNSGMRYSNHDGFSSAPPTVSVFENKGDGTTTTTTTTSVTRRTAKRLV
ncbi:hypothetical protein LTR97_002203 [Elasticomyces elasticus]|uniref:Uncharacterized protein n=1 Tax=Elasticomyces elasticus TaxID=574655 RepID=A0AAN7VV33_9PEZI|nr:hypothetical protein LTR97_002203 [Elasticomyces elasticus]